MPSIRSFRLWSVFSCSLVNRNVLDTPGFFDSAGPIRDIANAILISSAIREVRIILNFWKVPNEPFSRAASRLQDVCCVVGGRQPVACLQDAGSKLAFRLLEYIPVCSF